MVDQRLNPLYQSIDINEAELEVSRKKLETALAKQKALSKKHSANSVSDANSLIYNAKRWLRPSVWGPAAAAACLLLVVSLTKPSGLDAKKLTDIERFVAKHGNHQQLFAEAQIIVKTANEPLKRLNALAIISLLGTEDENKIASATGLVEDPRPEFRAYYLEYLLDYADEAQYSVSYIEALIEKEDDDECLYLLGRLLKLALSNRHVEEVDILEA